MARFVLAGIVSVGLLAFSSVANAADIKEGKWEMTTIVNMPGMDDQMAEANEAMANMSDEEKAMMEKMMGGMKMGGGPGGGMKMTNTQCITNENPVPEEQDAQDCETTHTEQGNTISFTTICDDSQSTGSITYRNNSMNGTIQSTSKGETVTIDISGKYVGPCDQS